jgi:hypothetical protein
MITSDLRFLVSARAARDTPTAAASWRGENGSRRKTRPAASAFAASTISEVNAAKCSAVFLMPEAHCRSRSPISEAASNSP